MRSAIGADVCEVVCNADGLRGVLGVRPACLLVALRQHPPTSRSWCSCLTSAVRLSFRPPQTPGRLVRGLFSSQLAEEPNKPRLQGSSANPSHKADNSSSSVGFRQESREGERGTCLREDGPRMQCEYFMAVAQIYRKIHKKFRPFSFVMTFRNPKSSFTTGERNWTSTNFLKMLLTKKVPN